MMDGNGMPTAPITSIGEPLPMVDGPEKIAGKALYTSDFYDPSALAGAIKRSTVAHARIVSVDTSAAEALSGVHASLRAVKQTRSRRSPTNRCRLRMTKCVTRENPSQLLRRTPSRSR